MKIFSGVLIILFALTITVVSYAAETTNFTPGNKSVGKASVSEPPQLEGTRAVKGFENFILGWTEIPKGIVEKTNETGNPIIGFTEGTFKGIIKALPRTLNGAADMILPVDPTNVPNETPNPQGASQAESVK